jgi:hypothetical protein
MDILTGPPGTVSMRSGYIGFFLYSIVKSLFLGSTTVVLWALGVGGTAIIFFERRYREPVEATEDLATLSYRNAALNYTLLGVLYTDIDDTTAMRNLEKGLALAKTSTDRRTIQKKLADLDKRSIEDQMREVV